MTSKGKQLKELIHGPKILITPGVFDGFSARLVQKFGFKTGSISGAGVSESKLGWADRGIMGYGENVEACRRIAACSDLLLQGDADTGYGNALNVHFVTRAFEQAGLAAISIEDQVWPKRCGHMRGKRVVDRDEYVQKIRAAADTRAGKDFFIVARTDAVAAVGLEEALARMNGARSENPPSSPPTAGPITTVAWPTVERIASALVSSSSAARASRLAIRAWASGTWPGIWTIAFWTMAVGGAFLLVTALSMVWAAVRLHGFALRRTGDDLRAEYDTLLARMQTPKARKGMEAAFDATPAELGRAAVKAARPTRIRKRA